MKWTRSRGFETRRSDFIAKSGAITYRVTALERIAGRFVSSPFFHAWMDTDYLGYAVTADGAKLICVLNDMEYAK